MMFFWVCFVWYSRKRGKKMWKQERWCEENDGKSREKIIWVLERERGGLTLRGLGMLFDLK